MSRVYSTSRRTTRPEAETDTTEEIVARIRRIESAELRLLRLYQQVNRASDRDILRSAAAERAPISVGGPA